jgi:hypothetical protein
VRSERRMYALLNKNLWSIHSWVRCTLDPRLMTGLTYEMFPNSTANRIPPIYCPLVDNRNAFIPILTNHLNSISGWPDLTVTPYSSRPGVFNEVHNMVDSTAKNYESFDLDCNFRNTRGDPILHLFYIWIWYEALVFEGILVPYYDFIVENEIDYNTRVYRLVLDQHKHYVTKIGACGVAFPTNSPIGTFFDFNAERPYFDQVKDISIRLRCSGAIYLDDILIKDFNDAVAIFNPNMRNFEGMSKIARNLVTYFNNRGYPYINPETYELEWWIDDDYYNARAQQIINMIDVLNPYQIVQPPVP